MMEEEQILIDKMRQLRIELLDFNKKIKSTKRETKPNASRDQNATENLPVESTRFQFSILKSLLYICPLIFPTLVYSIGGYGPLFWQVTAISSFIMFFLILKAFSFISYKIQEVICHFYNIYYGAQNKVKLVIQNAGCLGSGRQYQYTSVLLLLFVILAFGYWALQINMRTLFNLCLIAVGFVSGIWYVDLYTFWKEPEQLPYLSPLKWKWRPSSKTGLEFSEKRMKCPPSLNLIKYFRTSPEES